MDIVYYRKIAQLMLRECHAGRGTGELQAVATHVASERNPKKRYKRIVRSWMYDWLDQQEARSAATDK